MLNRALLLAFALLPALAVAQADLTVSSAVAPPTGKPGEAVAVRAVIANIGNAAAGAFKYTWFVSTNQVVTVSDQMLGMPGDVPSLAAQQTVTQNDVLALPATMKPGIYWLGLCVNYDPSATPEFGIPETSQINNCATATPVILITTGQVAVITQSLPVATRYSPYGIRLQASGGDGTYTWTHTGGTLPPGLSLLATGDLQGTPATEGTFAFDVTVTSAGVSATAPLSLMVSSGSIPLVVVYQEPPAAEFGRPYAAALVAVGGKPPYDWALKPDSRLPLGLKLSREGQLEGRATEVADVFFTVVCTDSAGATASRELKIRVVNPATLHIATAGLATGYLRQSYLQQLQAVGGKPGYDWTLVRFQQLAENATEQDGAPLGNGKDMIAFPSSLGLQIENGPTADYLRGTPKLAGLFLLTFKAVDSIGADDFVQLTLRINYVEGLAITTTALPDAFVSHEYHSRLGHNGTKDTPVTFSVPCVKQSDSHGAFTCAAADSSMSVPPGLVLQSDGIITGTPTGVPGTYAFLVKVTDDTGRQDVRSLSIRVQADYLLAPQAGGCGCSGGLADPALFGMLLVTRLALRRRRGN